MLKDKGIGEGLTEEEPDFVSVLEMKLSSTRELADAPRTKTKAAAWLRRYAGSLFCVVHVFKSTM